MKSRDTHLYVYSMSTRKPHQLAQSPRLVISSPESDPSIHPSVGLPFIMFALLQIAEDIVLMQFTTLSGSVHVRLWNWQTGDLWLVSDADFAVTDTLSCCVGPRPSFSLHGLWTAVCTSLHAYPNPRVWFNRNLRP